MRRHEIPHLYHLGIGISIPRSMESVKILPTGFRFHPTEEELVCYYLRNKVFPSRPSSSRSALELIREVDVYRFDPADLPAEAGLAAGNGQWFFFSVRGRRDSGGGWRSRATESGVWRIEGRDEPVVSKKEGVVGLKRTLAFYRGKPPSCEVTEWMINEYVLVAGGDHSASSKDSFAICRVFLNPHIGRQKLKIDGKPCAKNDHVGTCSYCHDIPTQDDETVVSSIAEIGVQEEAVSEDDELQKILMTMLDEEDELEGLVLQPSDVSLHHEVFAVGTTDEGFGTLDCLSDERSPTILEGDFIELNDLIAPLSQPSSPR